MAFEVHGKNTIPLCRAEKKQPVDGSIIPMDFPIMDAGPRPTDTAK
jgi:hypothetical protein